jgi:hypothetical protein
MKRERPIILFRLSPFPRPALFSLAEIISIPRGAR